MTAFTPMALPITEYRPMNRHQRKELEGYVAVSTTAFRALLFLSAVGVVTLVSWSVNRQIAASQSGMWWLLPPSLVGVWLLRASGKWTGGGDLRRRIREDIGGGVVAVRRVSAVDAIEIEEAEDEGPAYFLLLRDGRTLHVAFQELARYKARGFPWTEFEFIEGPRSDTFFSIKKVGGRLKPSLVRKPFDWDELKRIRSFDKHYQLLDLEFARLKEESSSVSF